MFEPDLFDATLLAVERELRVAASVGLSTMRVFLHEELYFRQGDAFLQKADRLLQVLARHGMSAMLVLFDAVWRPDVEDVQVIPGVHNSGWVQSPTHTVLRAFAAGDENARGRLERYVLAVVGHFAADVRVAVWDVYNEASMTQSEHWLLPRFMAAKGWNGAPAHWLLDDEKQLATLKLLVDAFSWARDAGPTQPLTSGVWTFPEDANGSDAAATTFRALLQLSDVISLHCYCEPELLEARLDELGTLGRPILLTEFMARPMLSTFSNSLPVLRRRGAWAYAWGLFRGRSQTHRPWSTWQGDVEEEDWFHDIFYENGTAYSEEDVKEIWWHTTGMELRV